MLKACFIPLLRITGLLVAILGCIVLVLWWQFAMPGRSHGAELPPWTAGERELATRLAGHVQHIASAPHHVREAAALQQASLYIEGTLKAQGHAVQIQPYQVDGVSVRNLEVVLPGSSKRAEALVIGAHYDSSHEGPGANDNGSGAAVLLELARTLNAKPLPRTVRLVWFVNEEPPYFQGPDMGSVRYAKQAASRSAERVVGMLSLETLGYYSDAPGSQHYAHQLMKLFYPSAGNYVAFVGNRKSRELVSDSVAAFRAAAAFPSQGLALPDTIPALAHLTDPLGYSDHWSFWQEGIPAIMVTDTAMMRYPHYHTPQDTPDKLDYLRLARVANGIEAVIAQLAR